MNVERITLTEIDDGVKMTVGTGTQEATEIDIPWRLVLWLRDKLTVAAFETSVGLSMRPARQQRYRAGISDWMAVRHSWRS